MKLLLHALRTCCLLLFCAALPLWSQVPAPTALGGVVLDPSGASIAKAAVHLNGTSVERDAVTDASGHFAFSVPPGSYDLSVTADGFQQGAVPNVAVANGRPLALKVTLALTSVSEEVNVSSDPSVSGEAASNRSALVFKNDQIDTFSDDPAVMQQQLQALGGSDPSNPPQIFVDGFSDGTLPPKESIREIRINQNPVSAFYDQFGQGRIEIFTKPGANQLHGGVRGNFGNSALNSPNPYATGVQPGYSNNYVNGNLNGPLGKKSSFYLSGQHNSNGSNAIIDATTLAADNVTLVPVSQAVSSPSTSTSYSLRFDRQFGANDTFIGRYTFSENSQTNAGIGQLVLPTQGYNSKAHTHTLQLTDTHLFGTKVVFDSGFQYIRTRSRQDPVSTAPALIVQGAFSNGGSPSQALHDNQDRLEFQEYFSIAQATHFVRTGVRYRLTRDANLATAGYNGQFIFPTLTAYQLTLQNVQVCQQKLASCQTAAQLRAAGGGASQFSLTAGTPSAALLTGDVGIYAEDEWKATPDFTFNYGLRFETQSAIPIRADIGPRVGFAWSIAPNKKTKEPVVVVRGGFGIFYQRFASGNILQSIRESGTAQQAFYVANPDFYPSIPAASSLTGTSATPYLISPRLHSPAQNQSTVSAERGFGKWGNVAANFYFRRTNHQFESLNINAPLPGTYDPSNPSSGVRPMGGSQNIYEFSSDGVSNGHTFSVNANINVSKKLSFWAYVSAGHQESDTSSANSFVSNSYNVHADAGRAAGYSPRQLYSGIDANPGWDTSFSLFIAARSSSPFNITTGKDNNGDTQYNDRPAFATDLTRASVVQTPYGNFDTSPLPGQTIIPVNYGNAPGQFYTELNFNKNFRFGPRPDAPSSPAGARPSGTTELPPQRYRLQFGVEVDNPLNYVNRGTPVGVLTSPNFGRSISLTNSFGNNGVADRIITLRTALFF